MFKVFIRLLLVIATGLLILHWIGSLLPRSFDFRVERQIAASPAEIYPLISDLKRWPEWTGWNAAENPALKIETGPVTAGAGASQSWSDLRGDGKLWLTSATPDQSIEYQYRFAGRPEIANQIRLVASERGTGITWSSQGRLPSGSFFGYFRGVFVAGMQRDYNLCLDRLEKRVLETRAGQ